MKSLRTFAIAGLSSAIIIAGILINPVLAAAPRGTIKKSVQNQTTNSERSDADNQGNALEVRPGDILKFTIEIRNEGDRDMQNTRLSDTLPAGLELVSNPSARQITEDIGTIQPGKTETKTYLVKVTSNKDGDVIENKACFTGSGETEDDAQDGCNSAFIKIVTEKPQPPAQGAPQEPGKQEPGKAAPEAPAPSREKNLPNAGPSTVATALITLGASAFGYIGRLFVLKRQQSRTTN